MHDLVDFEARHIPAVGVASGEFIEAARLQSLSLGFDPAMVFVAHPIQDRSDAELRQLAEQALPEIIGRLQVG